MNPPPIGEALSVGWNTFKENMGPIAIGILCAMAVSLIPLVGGGLAFAGFMQVSLKALRGQTVEPKDGFVGFEAPVDHIVIGLLQIVGLIACCVGVYVSQAIFFPGSLLILDRKMTWTQAKDECMARIAPNWGAWTLFVVVVSLVASSGLLLCGVGVLFTAPIGLIALAYAYERTMGTGAAAA
jgi:hypothetical protein